MSEIYWHETKIKKRRPVLKSYLCAYLSSAAFVTASLCFV
jgi:hypothetical protein